MLPKELSFLITAPTESRKFKVGSVIFFGYNSLESFYDRFPLVLVLSIRKGHNFLGFNLHYMPIEIRLLILNEMKNSGLNGTLEMSRANIPRRYFTNAIKSYNLSNIMTPVKVFANSELNRVINTIIPIYDSKIEVNIIKHLDKIFIEEGK